MVTINKNRRTDANRKFSVFSFQFSETLNRIRRTVANEVHSKIQKFEDSTIDRSSLTPTPLGRAGAGLISLLLAAGMMILSGCPGSEPEPPAEQIPVESVTINKPAAGVELTAGGGTVTLSVTIEPANATDKTVTWSSSNTAIATVSPAGVVTGVKEGTVTITATTKSGNKKADFPIEVKPDPKSAVMIELKSPITTNTTLKDLGLAVDYFYAANNQLSVENNATLTIEPGVTIKFTSTLKYGGILIKSGSVIKAIGTASKRIQFVGMNDEKGSWNGIVVGSNTDNQFAYCDFINAGNTTNIYSGIRLTDAKAGFSHCKISNGLGYGLYMSSGSTTYCQLTVFDNNVIEGYENNPPVGIDSGRALKLLEKFDMTSDFTKNTKPYISVLPDETLNENVVINQTTVPYYFTSTMYLINNTLTFNEGVTVYMPDNRSFNNGGRTHPGRIIVNGTAEKKVKFTRLPSSSLNWGYINFTGLKESVINHCIFEYGGNSGGILYLNSSSNLTLNNVAINNSQTYGVCLDCDYILKHSNVTFSNNAKGNVLNTCPNPDVVHSNFP